MKKIRFFKDLFILETKRFLTQHKVQLLLFLAIGVLCALLNTEQNTWELKDYRSGFFILASLILIGLGYTTFHENSNKIPYLKTLTTLSSEQNVFKLIIQTGLLGLVPLLFTALLAVGMIGEWAKLALTPYYILYMSLFLIDVCLLATLYFIVGVVISLFEFPPQTQQWGGVLLLLITTLLNNTIFGPLRNEHNYPLGTMVLFTLGLTVVLPILIKYGYHIFIAWLYKVKNQGDKPIDFYLDLNPQKLNIFKLGGIRNADIIFTLLRGYGHLVDTGVFEGQLKINETEIQEGVDFIYLCPPEMLPDEKTVGEWLNWLNSLTGIHKKTMVDALPTELQDKLHYHIKQLPANQRMSLTLALAEIKDTPIYFFHDTVNGLDINGNIEFLEALENLEKKGKVVLFLSSDMELHTIEAKNEGVAPDHYWRVGVSLRRDILTTQACS